MQFMCTFCFELLWNSISLCSLTTLFVCILFSGEFTGGGNIAVECSPFLVAEVETRGRFGKVDGRFPHWVTPYDGTRYSLIYVRHYFWFAVMTCFVSLTLIIPCYNSDLNHISNSMSHRVLLSHRVLPYLLLLNLQRMPSLRLGFLLQSSFINHKPFLDIHNLT